MTSKRKTPPPPASDPDEAGPSSKRRKVERRPAGELRDKAKTPSKKEKKVEANKSDPGAVKRPKIIKLTPARPFPKVPPSSNATGPYSARAEGKNLVCITRRVELGAYLRRCVDMIKEDGYRTLRLHAMGAAIPHALMLATSLPATLPFPPDEIKTSILTGTVRCVDEVIPDVEDEEEDEGGTRTRDKSCIDVSIVIGDGVKVDAKSRKKVGATKATAAMAPKEQGGKAQGPTKPLLPTKSSTST